MAAPNSGNSSSKKEAEGLLLGRYEIGKLLGNGTFAKVYLAKKYQDNESVAIKIMDKEQILKIGLTAHIKREISILRRVRHPNIVQLFELVFIGRFYGFKNSCPSSSSSTRRKTLTWTASKVCRRWRATWGSCCTRLSEVLSNYVKWFFDDTLKETKTGDISMLVLAGQMYYNGDGVPKDTKMGNIYFTL